MSHFPDTSFLCALYRPQENSSQADRWMQKLSGGLTVSSLLLLEFRQSIRFQIFLHEKDRKKGFSRVQGEEMLRNLQSDLAEGVLVLQSMEWAGVHQIAERLSHSYSAKEGYRFADILHVATALYLGGSLFLTFDLKQKILAEREGLRSVF